MHVRSAVMSTKPISLDPVLRAEAAFADRDYAPYASMLDVNPTMFRRYHEPTDVSDWRQVAALAASNLLRIAPHFYREHDVHLAAAQPHVVAIESFDWLDGLLHATFEIRDGLALVPDLPGFGANFRGEAIRESGYQG